MDSLNPGDAVQTLNAVGDAGALADIFSHQTAAFRADPAPGHSARDAWLAALAALLKENIDPIAGAIGEDFGTRSRHETRLMEIFPALESIKHSRRRLKRWMKPARMPVSMWFRPGRARIVRQPLGVVGIIVPWNYPVLLAVAPLVGALAAGNRAMVKMSEYTPRTGELFAELIARYLPPDQVAVVNGGPEVGRAFASMPFDHLLFTGSTHVGRSVMRAAADNLTPVTLELGGKSPAIIGPDFPIRTAASRIMLGKCLNAGQTCVAPDYAMLAARRADQFAAAAEAVIADLYPTLAANPDYSSVASDRHYDRLQTYLDDAREKGARIVELNPAGEALAGSRKIAPTLVMGVNDGMRIMQEEIFGPLLPVVTYGDLDEAIRYVNEHPRPLALYYFDYDSARIDKVLARTVAGGVTINDTMLHVVQEELPFGGVGPSGMGEYHGRWGFETFSKRKAVFTQSRINGMDLLKPPYGRRAETMLKLLLR
jgi:coniferyl-aldehyde dehydrogenase